MAMGMTVVIPDMDPTKPAMADPDKLVEAIQTQNCTSAFGSPAIWKNMALRCRETGTTLPSMRRILMAGAPVPVWMHEAFQEILTDGAELHTPYGATESLPVASIGSHEVLEQIGHPTLDQCVYKTMGGETLLGPRHGDRRRKPHRDRQHPRGAQPAFGALGCEWPDVRGLLGCLPAG